MKNNYFDAGFFAHDVLNLSAKDAYELCEYNAFIIDVRETYLNSFKTLAVEKIIYLPFSSLQSCFNQLPKDVPLIFADAVGLHSREAVMFMIEKGYRNVANLSGGIVDWERDGFPVRIDKDFRLSGSCICQLKTREAKSIKK